jgi:hypothetical protein
MRPIVKIARLRKSALPLPAYQIEHSARIDPMADISASMRSYLLIFEVTGFGLNDPTFLV